MTKRIFAIFLTMVLALALAGCGLLSAREEPTADDLVSKLREIDSEKYYDIGIDLSADMTTDEAAINVGLSAGVEGQGGVVHVYDTEIRLGMSGLSLEMQMEAWMDMVDGVQYMNITAFGQESGWTKQVDEDGVTDGGMRDLIDAFSNAEDAKLDLTLDEHVKGEDYIVRWAVDGDTLSESMENLAAAGDNDVDIGQVSVEARFDEATHEIKSVKASSDGEATVSVTLEFRTINGDKKLSVPADIVESAAESDGNDDIFTLGGSSEGSDVPEDDDENGGNSDGSLPDSQLFTNDGNGYDDVLDPLAEWLVDCDMDVQSIRLNHYDEGKYSTLYFYVDGGEWSGSVTVDRVVPGSDSYHDLSMSFAGEYEFLIHWYEDGPVEGSSADGYALFVNPDDSYVELDYIQCDGEFYVQCSLYGDTDLGVDGTVDAMWGLVSAIGYDRRG